MSDSIHAPKTEFVYLVTVEGEWPVSVIADDHPSTPGRIEEEVRRRKRAGSGPESMVRTHVWKARLADVTEVELIPAHTVEAELKAKTP
jgi:hypothetical protein